MEELLLADLYVEDLSVEEDDVEGGLSDNWREDILSQSRSTTCIQQHVT